MGFLSSGLVTGRGVTRPGLVWAPGRALSDRAGAGRGVVVEGDIAAAGRGTRSAGWGWVLRGFVPLSVSGVWGVSAVSGGRGRGGATGAGRGVWCGVWGVAGGVACGCVSATFGVSATAAQHRSRHRSGSVPVGGGVPFGGVVGVGFLGGGDVVPVDAFAGDGAGAVGEERAAEVGAVDVVAGEFAG